MRYFFKREGCKTVEVDATASGDAFAVTLAAEDSGQLAPGRWSWYARATLQGTGTIIVDKGTVDVLPDPSAAHTPKFSEAALAMVEASLLNDMPTAQESVSISGMDITTMSISERFILRDKIKAEIARERQKRNLAAGMNNRTGMQVRFI